MIYGIGVDLCSVTRIKNLPNKARFIQKFFSKNEQEYIRKKENTDQTTAGMFAAKEAFVKMLGTGFENAELSAIEILHEPKGRPYFQVRGWAEQELKKRSVFRVFLSITHEKDMAGAYVVAEKK